MLRVALLAVLILGSFQPAAAQYPERPLTIIVGYPAGGMVDIVARPMAESMKKKFPKGVAVLNRPGGGGSVGVAEAVQSKPDGYTLVLAPNSTLVIHPQLNDLPYKTPDDYEPIINTISLYTLLAVKADAPWKTVQEFVAAARANPGKLRVGSPGEGTISHLTLERWMMAGKFKTTHVPFSGWGESSPALLGGHIEGVMAQPGEVKPLVDAKKLRVLAVADPQRPAYFPDAPTSKEIGFGEPTGTWFVLTAPKGTSVPVLKFIHDAAKIATEEPAFVNLMKSRGVQIDYRAGDKLRQDLWKEQREYTEVLQRLGMLKKP
jgi:tripartite-type tricarboxylate transporter receptor subunit TctC